MQKILVADDQLVMRNMFKNILESEGYDVDYAENGKVAYTKATGKRFDLVITDLYMPELTGIQLTTKLRKVTSYNGIPILIVSTEGATKIKSQGRAAGASGWIVKPITSDVLLPAVKKLLS